MTNSPYNFTGDNLTGLVAGFTSHLLYMDMPFIH